MTTPSLDALRCSSSLPLQSIFPLLCDAGTPATILDPLAVFSNQQLELAHAMAQKSMSEGAAVSKRLEMEFLMWLACTPHADKAIELAGAKNEDDFILVVFGRAGDAKKMAGRIGLKENKKKIGSATALAFFGVKSAGQLYERMAISRIRN